MTYAFHARAIRRTFREALECGGDRATALGGRGTAITERTCKHQTSRGVTIPPPSQSGGLATALQGASHENVRRYNLGATQQRYPFGAAGFATLAVVIAASSVSISSFCEPREIV